MDHPTTRVLTVLELLQTYERISGPELARRLEGSPRSIRKYGGMLQNSAFRWRARTDAMAAISCARATSCRR